MNASIRNATDKSSVAPWSASTVQSSDRRTSCGARFAPGHVPLQLISLRQWRGAGHSRSWALPLEPLLHTAVAVPPQCFTAPCQEAKDAIFLVSLAAPVVIFAAAAAYLLRTPPEDAMGIFSDPATGVVFDSRDGQTPEVDSRGELAFRAVGYTPWPIEAGTQGERLRIKVGPVGSTQPRTYVIEKALPPPSALVVVTLPRPLGIVFEEEKRSKRAVVAELVPGGNADQRQRRAALDPGQAASAPREGDVLRAITTTNIVYPTKALLFGAQPPQRAIVLFGADGQRWPVLGAALSRGLVADGEVTVVLERRVEREVAERSSPSRG